MPLKQHPRIQRLSAAETYHCPIGCCWWHKEHGQSQLIFHLFSRHRVVKVLLLQGDANFVPCRFSEQAAGQLSKTTIVPWALLDPIITDFSEGFSYPEVHYNYSVD